MDYATFQSTYANSAGTFADNTTRQISEADLRQFASDMLATFALSASSSLSAQVYEIGDWNMNGAGTQTKLVYCGPSSNLLNVKYFGVEIITDDDASLLPRAKYISPYGQGWSTAVDLHHSALFAFSGSSVVNISASGFFTTDAAFDKTNYNRGYVTLFF